MSKYILILFTLIVGRQKYFSQKIDFIDTNLKQCLLKELKIDLNQDNEIELSEAEIITDLVINNKGIVNLSDLKYFKNLENLICKGNKLDTVILKDLKKLKTIDLSANELKILNIENLQNLKELRAGVNQLKAIKINNCPYITTIYLHQNELTEIDISNLKELKFLFVPNNKIKVIDISNNIELIQLTIDYNNLNELDIQKNINLKYIYVDDSVKRIMNDYQKQNSPFLVKPPPEIK